MWISSRGCTPGYGFPPELEPLPGLDGWWASPDVGELDGAGRLVLAGRLDDCVRTGAGHVEALPGVAEAVVVPVGPASEPVLAALVESAQPLDINGVREHLAARLPPSSMPGIVEQVRVLPRLPSGKPDRMACIARFERPR